MYSYLAPGGVPTSRAPTTEAHTLEIALACGTVFFAPVNLLKLPAFYFTLSDACACLCLFAMLANRRCNLKPLGPGTMFWIVGLFLMLGALLMSSLIAGAVDRGLILMVQYLFAYLLLPIILLDRPRKESELLMKVFVVSVAIMVLHGLYVMNVVGEKGTLFVSMSGRWRGFVERDNENGALIAMTVPMALALGSSRSIPRVAAFGFAALAGYGIMLTGSNTALYGFIIGLGLYCLFALSLPQLVLGAAGAWLAVTVMSLPDLRGYLPAIFQKRVLGGLETGDLNAAGTFTDRMAINREAIRLGENALFLGYGADQYRLISEWRAPVHNFYLLIWNEGGLIALAGFAIMITGATIVIASAYRSKEGALPALCAATTLCLFLLVLLAVPHIYGRFWVVPLLLALAPALALAKVGRE